MIKININEKAYAEHIIFNNAKFEVDEGKMIAIKGASGSGKSTLLAIIGLLENFDGDYYINDNLINKKNKDEFRKNYFSYVFQKSYLIPYLNVKDNIVMPIKNLKKKIDLDLYRNVINSLGISELEERFPHNLSGGEAQRVSIARAFMSNRKIMLCDEPTGSLDPENSKIVFDALANICKNQKYTIIVVTHSNDFDSYFDEIYYIKDKKVLKI